MRIIILFLVLIFICLFFNLGYKYLTIYKLEVKKDIKKKNIDLLNQKDFNLHKMNLNKWNYGNPDFAPYINGSYKQVTNNYVPGFKFNSYDKNIANKSLHNCKINIWKNKNNENNFFVQC